MCIRDSTHTHLFNGTFSGTIQVSRYQKGKTNLDFTEARDSEWQYGISWAICKSAPCSRQIATPAPHHSVFYRPDALPAAQPTAPKHWRHVSSVCSNVSCMCCKLYTPVSVPRDSSATQQLCLQDGGSCAAFLRRAHVVSHPARGTVSAVSGHPLPYESCAPMPLSGM